MISLTCDTWQASNCNAYFAVTGHWINTSAQNNWKIKSALFGFTQMNTAHNGARLGHSLYQIVKRLGIAHKVSLLYLYHALFHLILCILGWVGYMR